MRASRDAQQALKFRALHMTGRPAFGSVREPIANDRHAFDCFAELLGLADELPAIDVKLSVGDEHRFDFLERKSGELP